VSLHATIVVVQIDRIDGIIFEEHFQLLDWHQISAKYCIAEMC